MKVFYKGASELPAGKGWDGEDTKGVIPTGTRREEVGW